MNLPIYLDYAATTPMDPQVKSAMLECMGNDGNFGNAASRTHIYGWRAEEAVEDARNAVAQLINCDSREIVWTSGATEANNLAIKGVVEYLLEKQPNNLPLHAITSLTEHKSVLDCFKYLEKIGCEVTYIVPARDGVIRAGQVQEALRDNTALVSLMHVNNETGVVNDIGAIGSLCREKNVLFHVDAAQSAGKLALDLKALPVDLLSMSAHKMYGPKGHGALYVRRHPDIKLTAQIHGGGHERGMRSGTLATHQIVGMGAAANVAKETMADNYAHLSMLRATLLEALREIPDVQYNGSDDAFFPGIVNLSFAGIDGDSLLTSLRDIAISSGSACNSITVEPSYVLKAMGVSDELAHSALRISFGRFSTREHMVLAAEKIKHTVTVLRDRSPSWSARISSNKF